METNHTNNGNEMTMIETNRTPATLTALNSLAGFEAGETVEGVIVKTVWRLDSALTAGSTIAETSYDIGGMNYQEGDFAAA